MQPTNRSSFIPKKSIKRVERVRSGKQVYILSYIAYAIFLATLLATGAVFFYASVLEGRLQSVIAELDAQRVSFDQGDIVRIKEAERQHKIAEYLFNNHVSTYAIFNELERLAVDRVLFKTFAYSRVDANVAELSISGGSERFDSSAFQSSLLRTGNILSDAQFIGISKTDDELPVPSSQSNRTNQNDNEDTVDTPVAFTITHNFYVSLLPFSQSHYEVQSVVPPPQPVASTTTEGNADTDAETTTDPEANEPTDA